MLNPTHYCFTSGFYYVARANDVWHRVIDGRTQTVAAETALRDMPAMVPIEHWPPPEGATHFDSSKDAIHPWLKVSERTVEYFDGRFRFLTEYPTRDPSKWTKLPEKFTLKPTETSDSKYQSLRSVLDAAYDQAANGKGKERHANGLPFEDQRMQLISDLLQSERGLAFQAIKKLTEGLDLETYEARRRELLGAIVYIAGILIYWDRKE